jgi:hypothetical protein
VVNFAQSWIVIAMFLRETALVCAAIKVLLKKFRCKVFISVTWTYKIWPLSVLADANFPSSSVCKSGPEEIRADGKYKTYNMTYNTLPFIYHATISHHILPPCIIYHNTVYVYHIPYHTMYDTITILHHTVPYHNLPYYTT